MKHTPRTEHTGEEYAEDVNNDNKIPSSEPNSDKSDQMKLKVFIADDSAAIRNRLKEMLKEITSIHLIGEAGNAEQAIVALRDLKPDVVILDIHMPEGGGMRVLRDFKTMDAGKIAIIFTAFPYPQYRRVYLTAGADYFFDKTNDVQKMTDVLVELAQNHKMHADHENLDQEGTQAQ